MSPSAHSFSLTSSGAPQFNYGQTSVTSPVVSPVLNSRQSLFVQQYTETPFQRPISNTADIHLIEFLPQIIGELESVRPRKRKKDLTAAFPLATDEDAAEEPMNSHRLPISPASVSAAPKSSCSGSQAEQTTSLLLLSAYRNASAPKARKTQRNVTAFGHKVPPEVEHWRDFEIPAWLIAKDDVDAEGLEVEGQLLTMDTSGDLPETSINIENASVSFATFLQQNAGQSEEMMDVQDHAVGDAY